jgi:chaperonin cofactor prefoldin
MIGAHFLLFFKMKTEAEWKALEKQVQEMQKQLKALRNRVAIYEFARQNLEEQLEAILK